MDRQKLAQMREQRADAFNEMRRILDEAGDGGLAADAQETYTRAETAFDELDARVQAEERAASRDRSAAAPIGGDAVDQEREAALRGETRAERFEAALATVDGARNRDVALREFFATEEYREAFLEGAIRNRLDVPEYRNALNLGVQSEGGYTAPKQFVARLFEQMADDFTIRGLANVFATADGRELEFPVLATKGAAGWASEVTTPGTNESEPTFGTPKTMKAYVATREVVTSKDLLQDSVLDIEALIRRLIAESFGDLENTAFVGGDGTGKPKGFLLDIPVGQTVTGPVGQATSVKADDLIDVQHAIKARFRKDARWLFRDTTFKAVRKLKDNNGQYLWVPGIRDGESGSLLGKPYTIEEDMPALAANAVPIAFGDFSGYWIRDVLALNVQRLNELYARSRQIGFFCDKRVDGRLMEPEKVAAYKNSAT